ncbi:dihydrofolate reductase family protein [Geodermatophilus sp. SYSU D01176]
MEEVHRQDERADALLVGRRTSEDFRGHWPGRTDDLTGCSAYLDRVQNHVVSSTLTEPGWQHTAVLTGDPVGRVRASRSSGGTDIVVTGSITLCHTLIAPGWSTSTGCSPIPSSRAAAAGCSPTAPRRAGSGWSSTWASATA